MPKKTKKSNTIQKAQRESERKQVRRKKMMIIMIAVAAILALAITAYVIFTRIQDAGTETFTDGSQTVRLLPNGTFAADLYHSDGRRGRFEKIEGGAWTTIHFTYGGETVSSMIVDGVLFVPDAWQDACGHNTALQLAPR